MVNAWHEELEDDERNRADVMRQLAELHAAGWDRPGSSDRQPSDDESGTFAVAANE
jgi:hypothetical protein